MRLLTDSFPEDPALDTAVSRALMLRVASGDVPEALRLCRPGPSVAFGKRDVVSPGYRQAVDAARAGGYEAVERLAGGRAAVFHEGTIALAHAVPDPDPRSHVDERFKATAGLLAGALSRVGVQARVGEVPGEYCPGAHSVNARGERKLIGVGQRLVAGGVHLGAVVVVTGAHRVSEILVPVYEALGLGWRPEATGAVENEVPDATWEGVRDAIVEEYRSRYDIEPGALDDGTLALARRLAPEHLSPQG